MELFSASLPFLVFVILAAAASSHDGVQHAMQKRQIFREQVLPHAGGKIPEDAFRSDRLALNRLNALGISIPDGVLLQARYPDSHYKSHRTDPDIRMSIIKLVQKPDGRYAPPEGRYPFDNLIDSTYIIRPPTNLAHVILPPVTPIESSLRLPARPFFAPDEPSPVPGLRGVPGVHGVSGLHDISGVHGISEVHGISGVQGVPGVNAHLTDDDIFDINNVDTHFDLLNTYHPAEYGARLWTGFGTFFHDNGNRILRQTGNDLTDGKILQLQVRPTLSTVPKTSFQCPQVKRGYVMIPDLATACQAFHLCNLDGTKQSFLCPQGMRFDPSRKLCHTWSEVRC